MKLTESKLLSWWTYDGARRRVACWRRHGSSESLSTYITLYIHLPYSCPFLQSLQQMVSTSGVFPGVSEGRVWEFQFRSTCDNLPLVICNWNKAVQWDWALNPWDQTSAQSASALNWLIVYPETGWCVGNTTQCGVEMKWSVVKIQEEEFIIDVIVSLEPQARLLLK